jgi:hemerythrin
MPRDADMGQRGLRMDLFTWSEKYSVGVPAFDRHHQVLFQLINDLHRAMMQGDSFTVARSTFKRLQDYTQYHFQTEEKAMHASNYPDFAVHRMQHERFIDQIMRVCPEFQQPDGHPSSKLLGLMRRWLRTHIMGSDAKLGEYLRQTGADRLPGIVAEEQAEADSAQEMLAGREARSLS